MKAFADNPVLGSGDINEYFVNTKFAVKPNATIITSQTTSANDPDLQIHVDTNKTYWLELAAPFTSQSGTGFRFSFGAPAGTVLTGYFQSSIGGTTSTRPYSAARLRLPRHFRPRPTLADH